MSWSKYADVVRSPRWYSIYSQEHSSWYIPDDVDLGPDRETALFLQSILLGIPTPPFTLFRATMTYGEEETKALDILMDGVGRFKTIMSLYDPDCPWQVSIADNTKEVLNRKPLQEETLDYIPMHFLTDCHKLYDYQKLLLDKGYKERSNVCKHYRNYLYAFTIPLQLFLAIDERATEVCVHAHRHVGRYQRIKNSIVFKNPKYFLQY